MPKAERGTPKDIANRMKSRGLQKLKFFCQLCEKQCRDANGFKQHCTSESHLRQMKLFSTNANSVVSSYSKDFEQSFLTTLKMRHGTKKVNANNIYQEMISDKQHVHMNATQWTTLSEFAQYLGKSGKCVVEENTTDGQGGWNISFIERDHSILERKEKLLRREASDRAAEQELQRRMKKQRLEAAKAYDKHKTVATAMNSNNNGSSSSSNSSSNVQPIKVQLGGVGSSSTHKKKTINTGKNIAALAGVFGDDEEEEEENDDTNQGTDVRLKFHDGPTRTTVVSTSGMIKEMNNRNLKKRKHFDDNKATSKSDGSRNCDVSNKEKNCKIEDEESALKQRIASGKKKNSSSSSSFARKELDNNDDGIGWLYRDIIVRIISKKLEKGKYFRSKAIIDRVLDDHCYTAEVEVLLSGDNNNNTNKNDRIDGDILRLDQNDLETVVPKLKSKSNNNNNNSNSNETKVRILKGKYRGSKAIVNRLDKTSYQATLTITKLKLNKSRVYNHDDGQKGKKDNIVLKNVPYEDFSQIA